MRELLGDIQLGLPQAMAIAQAMQKVAESDGVHERETDMIEGFFKVCAEEAGQADAKLEPSSFDVAAAEKLLYSVGHKEALIKSCYLLALADGTIGSEEEACIKEIAGGLGISDSELDTWATDAKLYLLSQFETVSLFRDEAMVIGRSLGLSDDVINKALKN